MPKSVLMTIILIGLVFLLIPLSIQIPFIYRDQNLLELAIAYILLTVWFSSYVIYKPNISAEAIIKARNNKIFIYLLFFLFPLFIGCTLVFLTPITANCLCSQFEINEYKVIKVESYAKFFRQLSKLYVIDIYNNSTTFVIKNETLNQLNLGKKSKLITSGRSCFAGYIVDNINGIKLN